MKDKELSRRQMRWVQKLVDFNFKIMYRSGKQNIKVDAFVTILALSGSAF